MNNKPSFLNVERFSFLVEDNEYFQEYANPQLSSYQEANFIYLKYSPTISEFVIIEDIHKNQQRELNLNYSNIYWPANQGIFTDVLEYLDQQNYQIGMNSLYYLPSSKEILNKNSQIQIREVNKESFKHFININHLENLRINHSQAEDMKNHYSYFYERENTILYLAYLNERPVGSIILSKSEYFLEIKELLTNQADRKQGIATSLVRFASEKAKETKKILFVVADTEDTPLQMYEKMGFKFLETQINARK